MITVGIIANPASGKDIRRLVAYGTVFDNQEKVNIVRRLLLGLEAAGVERVYYMPDYYQIVPKAVEGVCCWQPLSMEILPVDMAATGTQWDSLLAAGKMRQAGAGCLITLGGDGTNRIVAKGCGDVPLVPVSTGTNNVFPVMVEGTIAGLAAGIAARAGKTAGKGILRTKKLIIYQNGCPVDIALVDAVVLDGTFAGARAVWQPETMRQAVLTRGEPHYLGISAIGGNLHPVGAGEAKGLSLCFGEGGGEVLAPIAPGLIAPVRVKHYEVLNEGAFARVLKGACMLALDGEREVAVAEEDEVSIQLTFDGPLVVDVKEVLAQAAKEKNFIDKNKLANCTRKGVYVNGD